MLGATAVAIAGGGREIEDGPALSVFAAGFGAGRVDTSRSMRMQTRGRLRDPRAGPTRSRPQGTLLLLADPYSFPVAEFLGSSTPKSRASPSSAASRPRPRARAATGSSPTTTSLTSGAVAVCCSDDIPVRPSCRRAAVRSASRSRVTRAERNLLYELGGQPAVRRLQDLVLAADETSAS